MATDRLTREFIVERTQGLLLEQGLNVSLSSVLSACGANKGSLYHFFPDGKDELLVAAVERQAECAVASNTAIIGESKTSGEAIMKLSKSLAMMIERDDFPHILPFSAAGAISQDVSDRLRNVCVDALESLQRLWADSLRKDGVTTRTSKSLASVVVSTIEGALLQSQTRRSSTPLKNAGLHLKVLIDLQTGQR